jgi:hypothetical protein
MYLDWLVLANPQLSGQTDPALLRTLIRQRQRQKALAGLAFRYSSPLHATLFDPKRPRHPVRRLAGGIARRLVGN